MTSSEQQAEIFAHIQKLWRLATEGNLVEVERVMQSPPAGMVSGSYPPEKKRLGKFWLREPFAR